MGQTEKSVAELQEQEKERIRRENLRKAWKNDADLSVIKSFRSEEHPAVDEIDEWFDRAFFTYDGDDD